MMHTWVPVFSNNYSECTWVSGKMSSVTRHNWLNTYVIGRRFERKLQKRLKHPSKKWCTLEFQYSLTTVNVHGFPGEMSSVNRRNWLNTYVICRHFERKLQKRLKHPSKKWCTLDFQYSLTTVNVHGFPGEMSSVTRHNWLNTYVIDRRFERKLQKRLKHPGKKWCTLEFQYSLTTVNVHGFLGKRRVWLAITR